MMDLSKDQMLSDQKGNEQMDRILNWARKAKIVIHISPRSERVEIHRRYKKPMVIRGYDDAIAWIKENSDIPV